MGRKKGINNRKTISLRLPIDLLLKMESIAIKHNLTITKIIETCLTSSVDLNLFNQMDVVNHCKDEDSI